MVEYILETKNLSFEYSDGTKALSAINLKIEKGKKVAFIGVNGSGKSTLFLNFNGVLRPNEGKVMFKGKEVKYNQKELNNLRKAVGIVFQDPENQIFSASVYQEVSFGAVNLKLPKNEVINRVDKALKDTDMYDYRDKAVHFLSYGQKKRVSIADILVMEPEIIIFDEPTSSLDPKHSSEIINIFNDINRRGVTVIVSIHDVELAYSWADYIFVMKDGKVEKEGTPYEIFSDNELLQSCYLEKPLVLEVYENMLASGKLGVGAKVPRNKRELFDIIN